LAPNEYRKNKETLLSNMSSAFSLQEKEIEELFLPC